jgi:hypothetical protein
MFKRFLAAVKAALLKGGKTPIGKAIEHAAVAGASVTITLLLTAYFKGNLDLSAAEAAIIAGGTTALAGLRAYVKKQTEISQGS